MGKNNATLYDPNLLIQAGVNPKTGLPIKAGDISDGFKTNNKKLLRIVDEQDAINRFTWYNLPNGLNQKLIERILYYKGQGMFFYMKENDQFYFLPYTLSAPKDSTGIDVYGRYTGVTPIPFNGSTSAEKARPWIVGLQRTPVYEMKLDELTIDDLYDSCVLLKDYTEQISQTNISRQTLNDPLLDVMSNCIPFMNTALLNSTGVKGMRVNSQEEYSNVFAANAGINRAALTGEWAIPVVGNVDFQELTGGSTIGKSEEFLLALQALDSYRLSLYGLPNGGLFQKKAHMLEAEQNMNSGTANLVLQDSLKCRQEFCEIVNSIWGLGIWCDINESIIQADMNGDGLAYDNQPDTVSYESDEGGSEYDE
jgi:hypothetical protein